MSGILTAFIGRVSVVADAFFNLVTLLLPGNGTNGAQNNTFLDSSTNNFTITRNGNTTQGTFSPFSQTGWSNFFGSGNNFLTLNGQSAFTLGTNDFTLEMFVYLSNVTTSQNIYEGRPSSEGAYPVLYILSGTLRWYVSSADRITSAAVSANTWYHVAVCRSSGVTRMFLNGSQTGSSFTDSTNYLSGGSSRPAIATFNGSTGNIVNGYISNLRLVNGTALYTTTFAPPTSPLTAVTNTALLTCQSNRFIDNSSNAFPITVNGTPSVQPFSPFLPTIPYSAATVGGSGFFDGSGDYLTGNGSLSSSTSMSTFTVEGWIYPTTFANIIQLIGDMDPLGVTNVLSVNIQTSGAVQLYWFDGASKGASSTSVMRLNQWNWFAIVVNSNAITMYVNSTTAGQSGTTTLTTRTQGSNFSIGAYNGSSTPNAYISNLRWSNGIARTISSIPTAPYTSDANTRLLLNFTNAGIIDATSDNVLETVGNAQISTVQSRFGGSSMFFNGTTGYLVPNYQASGFTAPLQSFGTGDFTIEAWVYSTVSPSASFAFLFDFRPPATNGVYPTLYFINTGTVYFTNNAAVITGSVLSANTWTHIAVCRSGTSTRLFINGTQSGSTYTDTFNYGSYEQRPTIASSGFGAGTGLFTGYIDEFRITRFARYTANFTPPTSAFPLQ